MEKKSKIDLTIIKKLVGELESALSLADSMDEQEKTEAVVELAKAAGLALAAAQEAQLLVSDISKLIMETNAPKGEASNQFTKLLGDLAGFKGGGKN